MGRGGENPFPKEFLSVPRTQRDKDFLKLAGAKKIIYFRDLPGKVSSVSFHEAAHGENFREAASLLPAYLRNQRLYRLFFCGRDEAARVHQSDVRLFE
jgi:hypothetical protein